MGLFSKNTANPNVKTPWYKTLWKTLLLAISMAGVIWGVFEVVWVVTNWHKDEVALENKVITLEKKLDDVIASDKDKDDKIESLLAYIEKKKQSFHVGFRVVKEVDEATGELLFKKRFRSWDGYWHEIHYDAYMSNLSGYDYYFYIDRDTGDKIYVIGNG